MAEFSLQELVSFIRSIGNEFQIPDVDEFVQTVQSDYEFFQSSVDREGFRDNLPLDIKGTESNFPMFIPQRYAGSEMEFIFLWHFVRYFYDGVLLSSAVNETFAEGKLISSLIIQEEDQQVDEVNIGNENSERLVTDLSTLRKMISELGAELFSQRSFQLDDFISLQ